MGFVSGLGPAEIVATEREPPHTWVAAFHCRFGASLAFWGWYGGAVHAFRDAIRADPDFAPAHVGLGEALVRQGAWWEASRSFREATRLRPSSVEIQGNLVFSLGRAGLWDAAVLALERLSRLRPNEADLHVLRGAILLAKLRRHADAIRAFRFAVRLETSPAWRRFFLGEGLLGARGWAEAVRAFERARRAEGAGWRGLTTLRQSDLNRYPGETRRTEAADRPAAGSALGGPTPGSSGPLLRMSAGAYAVLGSFFATFRKPHRAIPCFREVRLRRSDLRPEGVTSARWPRTTGVVMRPRSSRAPGLRTAPGR